MEFQVTPHARAFAPAGVVAFAYNTDYNFTSGTVIGLNSSTGKVVWTIDKISFGQSYSSQGPIEVVNRNGAGGFVFLGEAEHVTLVHPLTGEVVWTAANLPCLSGRCAFAVAQRNIFGEEGIALLDGSIISVIQVSTGALVWRTQIQGFQCSENIATIAFGPTTIVVACDAILGFSVQNGTQLFVVDASGAVADLYSVGRTAVIVNGFSCVLVLDPLSGRVINNISTPFSGDYITEAILSPDESLVLTVIIDDYSENTPRRRRTAPHRLGNNYPGSVSAFNRYTSESIWSWSTDDTIGQMRLVDIGATNESSPGIDPRNLAVAFVTSGGLAILVNGTLVYGSPTGGDYDQLGCPWSVGRSIFFYEEFYQSTPTMNLLGILLQ